MRIIRTLLMKLYGRIGDTLYSERGQTLVEHSLVIGSVSGSIAAFRDHPFIFLSILGVLISFLLFWKPKWFAALVIIAVLAAIGVFAFHWIENGEL